MTTNPAIERRVLASKVELRAASGKSYAEGYAAVFNRYANLGDFREMIMPGAFTRALRENQDVRALINHNPDLVLGRTKSGTLALAQDSRGLHSRCELPNTSYGRDLRENMALGNIDQCSFGFNVEKGGDEYGQDEENGVRFVARRVRDVNLLDVSCVTYPAYADTSCMVSERALVEARTAARVGGVFVARPNVELVSPEERAELQARFRDEKLRDQLAKNQADIDHDYWRQVQEDMKFGFKK